MPLYWKAYREKALLYRWFHYASFKLKHEYVYYTRVMFVYSSGIAPLIRRDEILDPLLLKSVGDPFIGRRWYKNIIVFLLTEHHTSDNILTHW